MIVVIDKKEQDLIALVVDQKTLITSASDAIDLVMDVVYQYQCSKIIFKQEQFSKQFFDQKANQLEDFIQQLANYRIQIAIVGNFLDDHSIFFATQREALMKLHQPV